jgi:hypothetical protein
LGLFRGDKPTYSPSQSCQFRATPCRDCDKIDRRNAFAPFQLPVLSTLSFQLFQLKTLG